MASIGSEPPDWARRHASLYAQLRVATTATSRATPSDSAVLAALESDPYLLPLRRIGDTWAAARLLPGDFRDAPFHDAKAVKHIQPGSELVLSATLFETQPWQPLSQPAWLLHTGHCGSTLLSRALGMLDHCHCLREPAMLQLIVEGEPRLRNWAAALLSRRPSDDIEVVVKPPSFWSDAPLLWPGAVGRVCWLAASFSDHVAEMLSRRSRRHVPLVEEAQSRAGLQMRSDAAGQPPASWPARAASDWLAKVMLARSVAARAEHFATIPSRALLQRRRWALDVAIDALGLRASESSRSLVQSAPLWQQHAKRPSEQMDAQSRLRSLDEARRRHCAELAQASTAMLAWTERHPQAASALHWATEIGLYGG